MKRLLFIFTMIAISVLTVSAQSDYYIKKAGRTIDEKIVGVLHDVVEDTD